MPWTCSSLIHHLVDKRRMNWVAYDRRSKLVGQQPKEMFLTKYCS